MTDYGRWTYRDEIASAKGVAAALLVHGTVPEGYPYLVVAGSCGRKNGPGNPVAILGIG